MQCYKTYAATVIIANYLENMPELGRKLPHTEIADWMALNQIEPEDVLNTTPQAVRKWLADMITHHQTSLPNAA